MICFVTTISPGKKLAFGDRRADINLNPNLFSLMYACLITLNCDSGNIYYRMKNTYICTRTPL